MPSTCASWNTETYKLIASSARPHCLPTNIRVGVIVCLIGLSALNINCHDNPYLSCIHPYLSANGYGPSSISARPSSESFSQAASTASAESNAARKETDGLNLKSGPALMRVNSCPMSSMVTMSTEPEGVLLIVVMSFCRESLKIEM